MPRKRRHDLASVRARERVLAVTCVLPRRRARKQIAQLARGEGGQEGIVGCAAVGRASRERCAKGAAAANVAA